MNGKAFTDFLITFSDVKMFDIKLRTDFPLKCVAQESNWKFYLQENKDVKLFFEMKRSTYWLWCLGEIFEYKGESCNKVKALERFFDDLEKGNQEVESLNGNFILICWDYGKSNFIIWTNRMGTYQAYYSINKKNKVIGSYSFAVSDIGSGKELDWEAITGFFGFGFFPQDKTYYKDIKIFKPASKYVFNNKGNLIESKRYWQWNYVPDRERTYKNTVAEFGNIIEKVVKEQTDEGKVLVPISGGLDSRVVVAALPERKIFQSFSYGWGKKSLEIEIAKKIAKIKKISFEEFSIEGYLFEKLDLIFRSVEGFQDVTISRQAAVVDKIGAKGDFILAAHWGDVWCDSMGVGEKKLSQTEIFERVKKKIRNHSHDWLLKKICKNKLHKDYEIILDDLLEKQLKDYAYIGDADFRIKAFKTDSWSFRWTLASIRMYQSACFPRLPFYDNRIIDFFLTVPSKFLKKRRLEVDYLKIFKPKLARVKWQQYGINLFSYKYFNNLLLPIRAFKKVARLFKKEKKVERNWQVQFLQNKNAKKEIENALLQKGLRIHELVSVVEIKKIIEKLFSKECDKDIGYSLAMLLTFSQWLEKNNNE